MNTIPTPRTDEFVQDRNFQPNPAECLNFAAQLERELAEALDHRDQWESECKLSQDQTARTLALAEEVKRQRDVLSEALRKAIVWAEGMSNRVTDNREEINWRYLEEARETLASVRL